MKNLSTLALATRISSTRLLAPRLVLVDFPTYLDILFRISFHRTGTALKVFNLYQPDVSRVASCLIPWLGVP